MPTQCFGTMNTWDMEAIGGALDAGYRHFDLAMLYGNHALLGAFFEERFKADASLGRSDVFLTTKIWTRHMRDPRAACEECLRDLRTDYLDCLLLHMPFGLMPNYMTAPDLALDLRAAWAALEALQAEGKVRSIGVSNFEVKHLERERIALSAYNPLHKRRPELVESPALAAIAEKRGKTPTQIALKWCHQTGVFPIPMSRNHAAENFDLLSYELDAADLAAVAALDANARDYNAGFTHCGRLSHESYACQRALEKAHDYLTFAIASAMPRPPLSKLGSLWALGIAVSLGVAEHVLTKLLRALRLVN
ncbi:oxidoreductase [Aureococcus anophagefferens]|nr:oxidoreductase [Aureococcus anophagefferens]